MKADLRTIAQRTYDTVETALWSGLVAFVVYFAAVIAPQIPKNQAIQEAARLHAIAEEHDYYCEKWGKHAGTREHALCVLDLQEYRAKIERQYAEFISF
jgi:hypothetical protein